MKPFAYFCPYCARILDPYKETIEATSCMYCGSEGKYLPSKHEEEYYKQRAIEEYGSASRADFILREEEIDSCSTIDRECVNRASDTFQKMNEKFLNLQLEKMKNTSDNPYAPKCPTCGSTNIKNTSLAKRAVHAGLFGLFSKTARSQFSCNNCGMRF